jgi:germination protein M
MIRPTRTIGTNRITGVLAALLVAVAACTPSAGPLGTPATPPASIAPSGEAPSDAVPSASGTVAPPTAAPSATTAPSGAPTGTPGATTKPTPTPSPTGTTVVRAYFVLGSFTGNEGLVPVLRTFPETTAVASMAMQALLEGPNDAEMEISPAMYTAIPDGSRLLGLMIKDGIATVDLTGAFASGGGTYSMSARLAQVVYTLTQFPTVDRVVFELDGKPVTEFSSEGIILDGPVGRADYRDMLPAIFVDRPAWGASIGNPGRVSGLANVFEATFRVQLLDAKGGILADEQVMASCGTGCWGRFSTDLAYDVADAQYGTLRVFDLSAKDGTPENVTEYKVWLTPAG